MKSGLSLINWTKNRMEFFESSGNWIIALGKTLVHSLWIGLLILSMLKIVLQFVPGRHSALRYRMALTSLILYVGSVTMLFFSLYSPSEAEPTGGSAPSIDPFSITLFESFALEGGRSAVRIICYICSYIYFSGILVMLIRSAFSIKYMRALRKSGTPVEGRWSDRFNQIREKIGIRQKVDLLRSEAINSPALIGLVKPAIIVPAGMLTQLPVGQVETILMHELYHLRRFDFLVNLIQLVVEALFFYNPAVWTISHQIRTEREKCCDDRVLEVVGQPEDYARALYQLAQQHLGFSSLAPSANGTDQYQLFNRIKRILNQSTMKTNIREKLYALLLMAGGVIILFTLSGFSQGFSVIQYDYFTQKVTVVPDESPADPVVMALPDTIPKPVKEELEVVEEELETVKELELIEEAEAAKLEALEEIDWEEIKKEIELSKVHLDSIMKDIDFDFDFDFDVDIDLEEMRIDLEQAMKEMKEINWDQIHKELEKSMAELEKIDVEQIRIEVEKAMKELESEKE